MILFGNMDQGRHIGGGKRVAERRSGIVLVLYRVMRLEPFLCHRQDTPLDRWPVHQTHSYSHLLTVSSSPVLYVFRLWEKPRGNQPSIWREHTNSTQKDSWSSWDSNTAHTAPHYTRLIFFFFFLIIASKCFYLFIFIIIILYVFLCFYFSKVNVDGFCFWYLKK